MLLRRRHARGGGCLPRNGLLEEARAAQEEILLGYERDISKHLSRTETEYVLAAWNSIPSHLGRENKKFVFGHITEGT